MPPSLRWTLGHAATAASRSRLARITQPVLIATGGNDDYFEQAADAVAARLADAERQVIEGQGHVVDPKIMAAVLARFFRP